jgi:hypothetical protein
MKRLLCWKHKTRKHVSGGLPEFPYGWVLYSQKDLELLFFISAKLDPESSFYEKSTFFAAYNLAYLNQTDSSRNLLNRFSESESNTIRAMENFQRAGISLLDRQFDDYRGYSSSFTGAFGVMAREEEKFNEYYERIKNQPKKITGDCRVDVCRFARFG